MMPKSLNENADAIPELRLLNRCLKGIVWGGVFTAVFYMLFPFIDGDANLILETAEGPEEVVSKELTSTVRASVVGITSLAKLCWLFGLVPLIGLTRRFSKAIIFEQSNIKAMQYFGISLLLVGVFNSIEMFLLTSFLDAVSLLKGTAYFEPFYILEQAEYLTAGLLILVVCQVLKKAVVYSEEAELTI